MEMQYFTFLKIDSITVVCQTMKMHASNNITN